MGPGPEKLRGDLRRWDLQIGGKPFRSAATEELTVVNPARGEPVATVPEARREEVGQAVEAAASAFRSWRAEPSDCRLQRLVQCREILLANVDELAWLDAATCGNPISACRDDIRSAAATLDRMAGSVRALRGETVGGGAPGELTFTTWAPLGVVGMIIPFNHPSIFATQSLAPISMGNTVVLKPSEQSPLSALRIAELFADVLPPGVLNVVTGPGNPTGAALVGHPAVDLIYFTGSSPVGRQIVQQAAQTKVKRTVLELGGKNPLIVCADSDLERAADAALRGMNIERCQGQSCSSTSRILVERSVYPRLLDAVAARMKAVRPADPLEESTRMGSLVSATQQQRVLGFIDGAVREGATVVTGGKAPADAALARGAYVEPTLLADVLPTMTIAREEVFGPVVSVLAWDDDEEALQIANSVRYGLTASVWVSDLGRAQRFMADLEAARVFVNSPVRSVHGMVAEAWKDSGLGLTGDWAVGIQNFARTKVVHLAKT